MILRYNRETLILSDPEQEQVSRGREQGVLVNRPVASEPVHAHFLHTTGWKTFISVELKFQKTNKAACSQRPLLCFTETIHYTTVWSMIQAYS